MSPDAVMLFAFILTVAIWFLTFAQNWWLIRNFCKRFPEDGIQYLHEWAPDPENTLFFIRPSRAHLIKRDPILLRARKRFIYLLILSVVVPVGSFLALGTVAVWSHTLEARQKMRDNHKERVERNTASPASKAEIPR